MSERRRTAASVAPGSGPAAVEEPAVDGAESDATDAPRDLRMLPVAAAMWTACWIGTSGKPPWMLGALAVAAAGLLLAAARRSVLAFALALILAGGLGVGHLHELRLSTGPVAELAHDGAVVELTVQTIADPHRLPARGSRAPLTTVRARVLTVSGRGQDWRARVPVLLMVTASERAWEQQPVGTVWRVDGRLSPPDGGSDVAAVVRVRLAPSVEEPPGASWRLVHRVRLGLRHAVEHRAPEVRALVPALVVGDTAAVPEELVTDFRTTGLSHLTAVSGANLTLLLAFLLTAARWCGVRGRLLRVVALAGVVAFVALCRSEPSVLRAAAMGLVALAALGAGGRRGGLRNLGVAAAALLLIDPFLARSYGFVLSVLACLGIVAWATSWTAQLRRWLPGPVAEAVSVPLAAQLATLPVVAYLSGAVSVVGLLANALTGPFVGPATVSGFAAAGLSLISTRAAAACGFVAAWSAQPIVWVAHLGAGLPGASASWPTSGSAVLLLAASALVATWAMPWLLARRGLCLALAVAMVVVLLRGSVQPGWPPRHWVFAACAVGQGDAAVLRAGPGQAVVVDVGPDPAAVDRCLDDLGVREVPLLVLTHFHADHVDGLTGLADRPIGQIWVSPLAEPAVEAAGVRQVALARGIPEIAPPVGASGQVGELTWQVLGPVGAARTVAATSAETESSVENDASVVLRVSVRGVSVLLTGDIEPAAQQAIVDSGADLRADVLKVPHHGSARQDPDFFAATGARLAVASMGADNSYGHPAARTIRLAESLGMTFLRTDQQGSVAVSADHDTIRAVVQHPRPP